MIIKLVKKEDNIMLFVNEVDDKEFNFAQIME